MDKTIKQLVEIAATDFLAQLKGYMKEKGINQKDLARLANYSEGYVSQIFRHPGNISIRTMVRFVRALQLKMAIVGHDADAPVKGEVIRATWEQNGRPRDFWDLRKKGIIPPAPDA